MASLAAEAQRYLAAVDLICSLGGEPTWRNEASELGVLPHMDELCGGTSGAPDYAPPLGRTWSKPVWFAGLGPAA